MTEGSLVVVLGKLDQRIYETKEGQLVIGTLVDLQPEMAMVLLPTGILWRGHRRMVAPYEEQLPSIPDPHESPNDDSQSRG